MMINQSDFEKRITLDSGHREEYATGARRDSGGDKPIPLVGTNPTWVQVIYPGFIFDRSLPLNTGFEKLEGITSLTPSLALNRLEALFQRGAEKYGTDNWQKGIPLQRYYESLARHLVEAWAGDTSEDHLAAILWNASAIMVTEYRIQNGELPADLGNAGALYYKDDNG